MSCSGSILETSGHTRAPSRPCLRVVELRGRHVTPALSNPPLSIVISDIYRPLPIRCQGRERAPGWGEFGGAGLFVRPLKPNLS